MFNRVQPKSFCYLVLVCFFLNGQLAFAEEVKEKYFFKKFEEKFISSNIAISEYIDGIAENIDNFIVYKKYQRKNETSIRVENISSSSEGQTVENVTHLNINLKLPNVEDYFQLKFTTYDQNEERGSRKRYAQPLVREQNFGAALGLFRNLGAVKTSFQPRIDLQDPLKVSHSLSFSSTSDMTTYEVNPKIEFFANPDKGTGVFLGMNLSFFLNDTYTLNLINEGEYEEKRNLFSTTIGTSLVQSITKNSFFAYSVFTFSNSRPAYHLHGYSFSVSWNHLLYKKILDYQVVPHLDFSQDSSFKGIAGIALGVSLNF